MTLAAVERNQDPDQGDETGSRELVQAREALLELLASTLDQALVIVTDAQRGRRLEEIAATCERIGFLGQAARRLGDG